MKGLNQDYQLVLPAILRRADLLFGHKEIATRRPDKSFHRYTYEDMVARAKRLAVALQGLGIESGDRVATLAWNSYHHLESYFGVPSTGAVLHTVNPRLSAEDIAYILNHAEDRVLLIDETMVGLLGGFEDEVDLDHVFVFTYGDETPEGMRSYEDLISGADEADFEYPDLDERDAAAMCYTSGTTGRPKGVLYSHRALCLHSMGSAMADMLDLRERDVVMPVVPMFHVNAWGIPFTSTLVGAKQVMPGPHLDPVSLVEDLEGEKVTVTAGVPTIWMGILRKLDEDGEGAHDLSALRSMVIGGSAAPEAMIRAFEERHGLKVVHAWGMTETTPLGTVCHPSSLHDDASEDELYRLRAKQGTPGPFVEVRARGDEGFAPWDGESMGELELRGPWVAGAYYGGADPDKFTDDGWFRTGDIVTIDPDGNVEIQDRTKDLIKSGGEWISSVALENALMAHDAVAEAAVISIPHEKWQERPLGIVVLKEGQQASEEDLMEKLASQFPRWYLPDAIEFVDEIPHTATGKSLKMKLREQFADYTPSGS